MTDKLNELCENGLGFELDNQSLFLGLLIGVVAGLFLHHILK